MSAVFSAEGSGRSRLAGDACLLTSGAAAAATLVALGGMAISGRWGAPDLAMQLTGNLLLLVAGGLGVVGTWLFHGRRITAVAIGGGLAGAVFAALLLPITGFIAYMIGIPLGLVTTWEFAAPVALLAVVSIAYLAVVVWLLVDAVRDLRAVSREHARLDVARMASAVLLVAILGSVVALSRVQPGPGTEVLEAPIFVMAAGIIAASIVTGADVAVAISTSARASAA